MIESINCDDDDDDYNNKFKMNNIFICVYAEIREKERDGKKK